MRRTYIGNIRWLTVVLVMVYHVFYLFNTHKILGALGCTEGIAELDALLYFVYPWFMVLLFSIAGMCAKYSLEKRSLKLFIKERTIKLIVPSTLGLFVYQWIGGYFNLKVGGALEKMPDFLVYPISAVSGVGPLWFAQTLFVFSVLTLIVRSIDKKQALYALGGRLNIVFVLLLALPIWGASFLLNMPVITVYRFGIYGISFLIGYTVLSHDSIQNSLERARYPLLAAALVLGVFYTLRYYGTDYTSDNCLQSLFTNVYLWIAVLAVLACGKAWLGRSNKFTEYMEKASFGLYVVHYPIALSCAYFLYRLPIAPLLRYAVALVVTLGLSPAIYELFRRIPIVRFLVLGIKKSRLTPAENSKELSEESIVREKTPQ